MWEKFGRLIVVVVFSLAIIAFYSTDKTVFADGKISGSVHHDEGSSDDKSSDDSSGNTKKKSKGHDDGSSSHKKHKK